jgi:hypothetical protein
MVGAERATAPRATYLRYSTWWGEGSRLKRAIATSKPLTMVTQGSLAGAFTGAAYIVVHHMNIDSMQDIVFTGNTFVRNVDVLGKHEATQSDHSQLIKSTFALHCK